MTIEPLVGVGAMIPGVKLTLVPTAAEAPLVESFSATLAVVIPAAGAV
ncbi:hypothetical protein [Ottowia sp.]